MKTSDLLENEFNYFYATYLNALDKDDDIMSALVEGKKWFTTFMGSLEEDQLKHKYAPGKWSIAEVLTHLIDTERIFQYRAFRISKNDKTPLPGFEQDDYVAESDSASRNKEDILSEYLSVREASISLFKNLPEEKLKRIGTASGMPWSAGALGLVISGHQKHHARILEERYL